MYIYTLSKTPLSIICICNSAFHIHFLIEAALLEEERLERVAQTPIRNVANQF